MLVKYCYKQDLADMLRDWDPCAVDILYDWLDENHEDLYGEELFLVDPVGIAQDFHFMVALSEPSISKVLDETGAQDAELIGWKTRYDGMRVYVYRLMW